MRSITEIVRQFKLDWTEELNPENIAETRVKKRRPKNYKLMNKPRKQLQEELASQ